jgi:hemolysin activation/secretion protein
MPTHVRFLSKVIFFFGAQSLFLPAAFASIDAGALQQNLEKQIPPARSLPQPSKEKPSSAETSKDNDVSFVVNEFVLEGVSLIPESQVQAVLKPYIGISLNFSELQKACDAIANAYREQGYSVQVIVLPQSMSKTGGSIKLRITEAKLSSVVINVLNGDHRFGAAKVEKYITDANPIGQFLNLNQIERSLILLNETPGVIVTSQLDAGKEQGDTELTVNLGETPFAQGRTEFNNVGSRSTGTYQVISAVSFNNSTGIGDQVSFNLIGSDGSQYMHGTYSLPLRSDGLRLSMYGTYLKYKNVGEYASPNGANGYAWTHGYSVSYPLVRSKASNINATFAYDVKSYLNELMATNTTNSEYNIKNIVLGISGNVYDNFGGSAVSNGSVSLSLGELEILPTSITGYGEHTPSLFTKLSYSGSRNQTLDDAGKTSLFLAFSGQFASVNLNSAEQFYLGGPYGVRAYPVSQGGGSQGGIFTAEFRRLLPDNLTASVFFDAGIVQQYKTPFTNWKGQTNANNTYSLKGTGISMKWSEGNWNVSGTVAWVLGKNPLFNQKGEAVNNDGLDSQARGWINVSYSF